MISNSIPKKPGIYTITNILNNKIYVGHSKNLHHRCTTHKCALKNNTHANEYLQKAYNKDGSDSFLFEVLEECEIEYLHSQEHYWCNLLNVHNNIYGYNISLTDPNGKSVISEETKEKLRKFNTGKKLSEETKQKIGESCKGKTLGRKNSEESKAKMREAHKGRCKGENNPFYGKKHSLTSILKIKKAISERGITSTKNPNFGNTWTEEQRKNFSNKRKIPILQYDLENNFIKEWPSADDASKVLKLIRSNITACCRNKTKSCGSFKWKYKNENILTQKQ